jgi:molybdenum cofactor synthesis domain-containing protein
MRPFTSTISLEDARSRLDAAVRPIGRVERVDLFDAAGRVAASTVASAIDVPPFARSAMDGYAVRAVDTTGATKESPRGLHVIDRIYAGQPSRAALAAGECAEIATGAPLPAGADAVVMVEDTGPAGAANVNVHAAVTAGQHVGPRGADIAAGAAVIRPGELLTPSRVGALAAVGCAAVDVYAKPRVAILSTGNEVVDPGRSLRPGQIYDVNRFTLAAIVREHGGVPLPQPAAEDSVNALGAALDRAMDADVIVFSGGSSVGTRDLIVDALAGRGEIIFHGVAVRPGKPTAFARVGNAAFFGMPGNPTSCLSNAYVLFVPFLRATARLPLYEPRIVRAPLAKRIVSAVGRHQFYTVRLADGAAHPAFKGSGDITSLSQADGYIEIPADQSTVEEGTAVDVKLF